ncbi:MAG: nicotinate phosphoribosyltransferase [Victivallales bacterium]|nr:nicotinate phosphoribosyltransferase [Victivallales bacterium]MCF7888564.1 nicotinate phosphoribosyltransferase [Victivallales bacterium]
MEPVIKSLLDNDLYKFTMLQAFYNFERQLDAEYRFTCRTENIDFSDCIKKIKEQLDLLSKLSFKREELEYLNAIPYFKTEFIDFLSKFRFDTKYIVKCETDKKGQLQIIIKGPVIYTSLFEVPILAIVNQLYFNKRVLNSKAWECGELKLKNKINFLNNAGKNIFFADFGTRRRYSLTWHEHVIDEIIKSGYKGFIGTSNVYFAKKYNIKPVGTMAHEWIMAHAGTVPVQESTELALKRWIDFYEGELGIALTDTYTTDHYLTVFNENLAKAYTGVRHDSGDWKKWGLKMINHYNKLGINPKDKILVFSDNLNFKRAEEIYEVFHERAKTLFGIGTNLTNDVGIKPIQIVIKLVESNGNPVIKISDSPGKLICKDEKYKNSVIKYFNKFI